MATTTAVFKASEDAGEQVVVGKTYDDPTPIIVSIPVTGGPFVDVNGDVADGGTEPIAQAPAGWSQAAADITPAEFALLNMAEANLASGAAGPYDYDDEPASYDTLFGNVRNSGGTNFPGGVFQPTVTGTYRFTQELGITGNEVWANLGTTSGGSQLINNNGVRLNDSRESSSRTVNLNAGQDYFIATAAGGSTGRSSIRVKIELSNYVRKAVFSGDVEMPTSFAINTVGGNVNGNNFTVNGVYRGNNTGAITGSTFGNWTWRIRVKRFGDYIEQHYWNDTANIGYRESYDGGATWSAWGV